MTNNEWLYAALLFTTVCVTLWSMLIMAKFAGAVVVHRGSVHVLPSVFILGIVNAGLITASIMVPHVV